VASGRCFLATRFAGFNALASIACKQHFRLLYRCSSLPYFGLLHWPETLLPNAHSADREGMPRSASLRIPLARTTRRLGGAVDAAPGCRGRDGIPLHGGAGECFPAIRFVRVARSCAAGEKREGRGERNESIEPAMSPSSPTRCTACHHGELTPTRLTVTLTYLGKSFSVDDDDALVCNACGEQFIGERAAAFLLTQRTLAPDVEMTATVTQPSRGARSAGEARGWGGRAGPSCSLRYMLCQHASLHRPQLPLVRPGPWGCSGEVQR
jgi:YgiT-type zinc finger domain-containing protein